MSRRVRREREDEPVFVPARRLLHEDARRAAAGLPGRRDGDPRPIGLGCDGDIRAPRDRWSRYTCRDERRRGHLDPGQRRGNRDLEPAQGAQHVGHDAQRRPRDRVHRTRLACGFPSGRSERTTCKKHCVAGSTRACHPGDVPLHPGRSTLRDVPQPVVADVNGAAIGAGACLALACDPAVMATGTFMQFRFGCSA